MKTHPSPCGRRNASALVIVMLMSAIAISILAGTMQWTTNNARLNQRSIEYLNALSAAEAATEKVIAELNVDFAQLGPSTVNGKMPVYKARVPKKTEHAAWGKYKFSNGNGAGDEVGVDLVSPWQTSPLISQYEGLSGYAATYRIRANAKDESSPFALVGSVQQDIQVALVPIFQFAIFYNMDMEINPGATMNINGRAHGNANIYLQPNAPLTFDADVTSAGEIIFGKKPGDPTGRTASTITFNDDHDSGVMSLNLPIGSENTPEAVRQIVEVPPNNESPNSTLGKSRFYNLADLVITVKNNGVEARGGGLGNGNGMNINWSYSGNNRPYSISNFVKTGVSFYDQREQKTINVVEIDIAKFNAWNA
ncbi:MAG TPA: hypothetical protein PKA41_19225, partial [Verrucomicrobiota bacterium]|nr:hypothetical protein [Verrucomicrobiota bacterium]